MTHLFTMVSGCEHSDVGSACQQLLNGQESTQATHDPTTANTKEVVEQNAAFPCEQLLCVASEGIPGYCSAKCLDDAGCPAGFSCRVIQTIGPFANEKFCAWKRCKTSEDCGSANDFCCRPVAGVNSSQEFRLCAFSNKGKC